METRHPQGAIRHDAPNIVRAKRVQRDSRLPIKHNRAFTCVHFGLWKFDEEADEWLPEVGEILHVPGANGVSERGNPNAAKTGAVSKGGIIIEAHDSRLGEFIDYLAYFPTRAGRRFYCMRWTSFTIVRNGRRCVAVPDKETHRGFLRQLYVAGIVPPMPVEILSEKIQMLRGRINTYRGNRDRGGMTPDAFTSREADANAMMARWEAAFDKLSDNLAEIGATPQPIRRLTPEVTSPDDPHVLGELAGADGQVQLSVPVDRRNIGQEIEDDLPIDTPPPARSLEPDPGAMP